MYNQHFIEVHVACCCVRLIGNIDVQVAALPRRKSALEFFKRIESSGTHRNGPRRNKLITVIKEEIGQVGFRQSGTGTSNSRNNRSIGIEAGKSGLACIKSKG